MISGLPKSLFSWAVYKILGPAHEWQFLLIKLFENDNDKDKDKYNGKDKDKYKVKYKDKYKHKYKDKYKDIFIDKYCAHEWQFLLINLWSSNQRPAVHDPCTNATKT